MNDKKKQIEEIAKEMECFNCIHATVCSVQKGGVNLQLVNSVGCGYHQPKLPEGSVVLSKKEWEEKVDEFMKQERKITELSIEIGELKLKLKEFGAEL